ncbi:MAG: alpha/beta hydrolase [gamma proteobacterium symbiont of Taylorina sp.]|nr:alpha/beta hydrolase [gamma proteobacterium symbiont of Taylorina sp.]
MPFQIKTLIILFISLFLAVNIAYSQQIIQLNVTDKIIANAEFYQGDTDKPYILILHGFLQTHQFPTVKRLAESLHESGYNVLTPTLSLNINQRTKSLACEAIHTHSLKGDLHELNLWLKWLERKTISPIVLIGHSIGALMMPDYISTYPSDRIQQVIFLSMPNFASGLPQSYETLEYKNLALKLIKNNDRNLHEFGLSYCKKFITTAEAFLSYYHLSKEHLLTSIKEININKALIIGSEDNRVEDSWKSDNKQLNIEFIRIEGANHFFDYEHEFELLENVEKLLDKK